MRCRRSAMRFTTSAMHPAGAAHFARARNGCCAWAPQRGALLRSGVKNRDQRGGEGRPVYVIAEIGINHNGSVDIAKRMIDGAVLAGCDAVKFQKRTPELCVPRDQWHIERDTPWGRMTYIDYRHKIEFGAAEE